MNKMIVCIDFTQDGSRTITDLYFDVADNDINTIKILAKEYGVVHDETYIVDFNYNDQSFIDAIVKQGERI